MTVALASDCNPGSSYTSSMALCIALAVREMRLTPAEALWAATAGGARALRRDDVGVLAPGRRAHLTVLEAPSHLHLAYRPGVPLVAEVLGLSRPGPRGTVRSRRETGTRGPRAPRGADHPTRRRR